MKVLNNQDKKIILELTKEELNIIHNSLNHTYVESKRNKKFSIQAQNQYKKVLTDLENI